MPKKSAKKKPLLPVSEVLSAINRKDRGFWNRLPEEKRKHLNYWLLMRYTSTSAKSPEYAIVSTNDGPNMHYSSISQKEHSELMWLLYTVTGIAGDQKSYQGGPQHSRKRNRAVNLLMELDSTLKVDEAELLIHLNGRDYVNNLAEQHGLSKSEIKELWK
jgi:hypothetical protein